MRSNNLMFSLLAGVAVFLIAVGIFVYYNNDGGDVQPDNKVPADALVDDDSTSTSEHQVMKPAIPADDESEAAVQDAESSDAEMPESEKADDKEPEDDSNENEKLP